MPTLHPLGGQTASSMDGSQKPAMSQPAQQQEHTYKLCTRPATQHGQCYVGRSLMTPMAMHTWTKPVRMKLETLPEETAPALLESGSAHQKARRRRAIANYYERKERDAEMQLEAGLPVAMHVQDGTHQNKQKGLLEQGEMHSNYVLFIMEENEFRVQPIRATYGFKPKRVLSAATTLEQAEEVLQEQEIRLRQQFQRHDTLLTKRDRVLEEDALNQNLRGGGRLIEQDRFFDVLGDLDGVDADGERVAKQKSGRGKKSRGGASVIPSGLSEGEDDEKIEDNVLVDDPLGMMGAELEGLDGHEELDFDVANEFEDDDDHAIQPDEVPEEDEQTKKELQEEAEQQESESDEEGSSSDETEGGGGEAGAEDSKDRMAPSFAPIKSEDSRKRGPDAMVGSPTQAQTSPSSPQAAGKKLKREGEAATPASASSTSTAAARPMSPPPVVPGGIPVENPPVTEEEFRNTLLLAGKITAKRLADRFKKRITNEVSKAHFARMVNKYARSEVQAGEKFLVLKEEYRYQNT